MKTSKSYQLGKVTGCSKIVFKIFNPTKTIYYGSRDGYDWEFFSKNNAKKWAKSEKLKGFEIHKLELISLAKQIEIV